MNIKRISTRVKQARDSTVAGAQKMNKIRQLSSRIHREEKKINTMYTDMGKKLYDLYKDNALEEFEAEFQAVGASYARIDDLQEQLRDVRGVRICPNCKSEVSATERFCPNCGCKMPELIDENQDEEMPEEEGEPSEEYEPSEEETVPEEEQPADAAADSDGESTEEEKTDP